MVVHFVLIVGFGCYAFVVLLLITCLCLLMLFAL